MVQGSTYLLRIKPAVSLDIVSKIIFTFAKNNTVIIKKEYPENVKITEDGNIGITLSQEDTLSLIGTVWIEAQYIFVNHSTGKTIRKPIYFRESQYTENVWNNDSENQSFGTYNIDMEDPVVVVITGGGSGEQGADGATFIPYVSEDGIISWTNDKNLENPDPVNIKGGDGASIESLSIEDTGESEETDPLTTESYVESKIYEHNTEPESHYDIRELITVLTYRLNAMADSDDETLDQLSEIVAYIKSNKSLIDAITTSKISVSDIVDNLTSSETNKPLSAAQGKALKGLIDAITIPDKLPNPNSLTFTGAVTGSYDGSSAVTVNVPSGGGSGGTDISLGMTGATVGQIAKITAVDEGGKPTAWEAVDVESCKAWRLLDTIDFSVVENQIMIFEWTDLGGVSDILIFADGTQNAETVDSGYTLIINDKSIAKAFAPNKKTGSVYRWWAKAMFDGNVWYAKRSGGTNNSVYINMANQTEETYSLIKDVGTAEKIKLEAPLQKYINITGTWEIWVR